MADPPTPLGDRPRQDHLDIATKLAFESLAGQTDGQLEWLGATRVGAAWRVPVLNGTLHVDAAAGEVTDAQGEDVEPHWRILALHYLSTKARPERGEPQTSFAHLPAAQSYAQVYRGRVLGRLCATAGRDAATLTAAAEATGGRRADAGTGDLAFDFDLFPRLAMRLIWHAPDEEFGPSATLLLPANIEAYLCIEDIVVLSERLVSRLQGR